ncbi:MAG TPA: hypothetical protein VLI90_20265, partial [Tepidisphaeraceae bacterium]|nr:hypothetical protein [Tepidisphaeraceae bacterium]
NGERIVYTMLVPITNPDPGPKPVANLLFNFYPNQGSPLTAPPPQLVETKGTLFATVKAPVPVSP